jgi:hypothetical protein
MLETFKELRLVSLHLDVNFLPVSSLEVLRSVHSIDLTLKLLQVEDLYPLLSLRHNMKRLTLESFFGSIVELKSFSALVELNLSEQPNTGDLAYLQDLTKLKVLVLRGNLVSGDLSSLHKLKHLQKLNLDSTLVSGDIDSLNNHRDIEEVCFGNTVIRGRVIRLRGLTKLRILLLTDSLVIGSKSDLGANHPVIHFENSKTSYSPVVTISALIGGWLFFYFFGSTIIVLIFYGYV